MAGWLRGTILPITAIPKSLITLPGQHRHIHTLECYKTTLDGRLYATHYVMAHFWRLGSEVDWHQELCQYVLRGGGVLTAITPDDYDEQ